MKNCLLCKEDYEEVKSLLGMERVAEFYGCKTGRNRTCLCPFHNDNHPSMKIYPDNRGFYCWSCGAGGDVIRFTALLFGLGNCDACRKLIEDFSLPIKTEELTYREKRERQNRQNRYREIRKFKEEAHSTLWEYRKLLCDAAQQYSSPHFDEAMQELSIVEYRLECIKECPEEYYADRKAVRKLGEIERRIAGWDNCAQPCRAVPR